MKLSSTVTSNWPILLILLVTIVIHLWRLDSLVTVGGDQGYDLFKIKGVLDGDFTLLGSPIGRFRDTVLYLGPLYYYLQAPFLALSKLDPIGLMVPIIIARLTTTLAVYLAARKIYNRQVAQVAAVISAVSPYFVNTLGPPSQPYLIPATVAIIIFSLTFRLTFPVTVMLGFFSGLMIHFHYLGLFVFLPLVAFVYFKERKLKSLRPFFLGFFLPLSPILLFEIRNNFFLSKQIIGQLTTGVVSSQVPEITSRITASINFLLIDITGFSLPTVASVIVLIASLLTLKKTRKEPQLPMPFFLISIVATSLFAASLYGQKVQPHYLAAAYAPLFIVAGVTITSLAKFGKIIPVVLTLVIALALIKGNDLNRSSGYTMPEDLTLTQIRQISRIIAGDIRGQFNITSTLDGDSRALPYRYLLEVYGAKPLGVQEYDRGDSLFIITRDPARSIRENSLFEIASFQPSFVQTVWNINGDIKLIKLIKQKPEEPKPPKFITVVNPVRPRNLWNDQSIGVIESQIKATSDRNLKATWLLSFDNLFDLEITGLFTRQKGDEIGAFLEVSEKWATDSRVAYKISEGDYYRPDKVFLSGYSPKDREKLIKTYFKKFNEVFGDTPKSIGAWYIDANSQNRLAELGVTSALTVADQFDTDAASIWGKYWAMPFYPSKLNSLEPAKSQSDKLPIVNLQWAQRDLVAGYGREIKNSRQSFQANDYINNGYDTNYFTALFENYLRNAQNNDFMQITIGLEAGQEAQRFAAEFTKQLDIVSEKQKSAEVEVVTMEQFANWYRQKYPGISPSHLLGAGDNFWYMSPRFRVAVAKDNGVFKIRDLRYYDQNIFDDYYYGDNRPYLKRNLPHLVDDVLAGNSIDLGSWESFAREIHFDRLTLKLDNRLVQINENGVQEDGTDIAIRQIKNYQKRHRQRMIFLKIRELTAGFLNVFRYSVIDGHRVFGLSADGTTIIGFRDLTPGVYKYDFQVAARFLSPAKIIEDWQP